LRGCDLFPAWLILEHSVPVAQGHAVYAGTCGFVVRLGKKPQVPAKDAWPWRYRAHGTLGLITGVDVLSKTTVKLNKSLCQRAAKVAQTAGYSSVEEFLEHVLEKELAHFEESDSKEDVIKKLKGLGYLE
jgi:hypothetical protein